MKKNIIFAAFAAASAHILAASCQKQEQPELTNESKTYTAVYPASIIVNTAPTLSATQTYAAGKFNAPMCAMSSTESLEFKNFCGVLCWRWQSILHRNIPNISPAVCSSRYAGKRTTHENNQRSSGPHRP